jgi:hypothetical protein
MGNVMHVFAIAAGGAMNHWTSVDGGPWSAPTPLPSGGPLEASFPCALTLADDSLHVFAIAHGGPLCHWRSDKGAAWGPPQIDSHANIPGNGNGIAAVSRGGSLLDAFATTPAGIVQYTLNGSTSPLLPGPMLPNSGGLNSCVLAACSGSPTTMDVFSVEPHALMPLRWHFDGANWTRTMLPGPQLHFQAFAAVCPPGSSTIELFSITADLRVTQWTVTGNASTWQQLPASPWPLVEGVVAAVVSPLGLDVFATGQGGPLVRWHFDGAWHSPVKYDSGLAAGGIGAAWGDIGLEAFGFQSGIFGNPLLHWPAGLSVAKPDGCGLIGPVRSTSTIRRDTATRPVSKNSHR